MMSAKIPCASVSLVTWFLGALLSHAEAPSWMERLTEWVSPELAETNRDLLEITQELESRHVLMGVNSSARRGFETRKIQEGEDAWIELNLQKAMTVDSVVLVPMLAKGAEGQVPGYGFPDRYLLEAEDEDGEIHILRDESIEDLSNPGWYPVLIECPPEVKLSRFRLTATEPWSRGGQEVLALAEIMILKGNQNFASGGEISASSSRALPPTWATSNLIDMVTPLGLPVTTSARNPLGWRSENSSERDSLQTVIVDLGAPFKVDEIRLVPAWSSELPLLFHYGFPSRFRIDAYRSGLGEAPLVIIDQTATTLQSPGQNIQVFDVGGSEVRFIKIESTRLRSNAGEYFFALAELQAYSNGKNVARNAEVISSESVENDSWGKAALTDGLVGSGELIELPNWLRDLEGQRDLECRQADLKSRREELFREGQQRLVGGSIAVAATIGIMACALLWRGKRQRGYDREQHRERLARDLHDELGSNLGSIALISSFSR